VRGKLNLFQATMLRFRELHPYVAVHMVGVTCALDAARLKLRIERRLETAGLTGLALDPRRKRFEFRGGPAAVELSILAGGEDPRAVAQAEIERQLNCPFPREGVFMPFRFFAVDSGTTSGANFQLGIAYDHFIAGGDSIAVLLEKLATDYESGAEEPVPWTPRRYPRTYSRLFLRHLGYALRGLARLPSMVASCRRSCRAPCRTDSAATNAFLSFRVAPPEFAALLRTARDWGVTLNDLFLAMLLLALVPIAPNRTAARTRNELGIASIVNLRAEFESDASDTFGQFLASLRVSHPVPREIGLRRLAVAIHSETERIKTGKLYLQTLLALAWVALVWRFLGSERRRRFLAKHYPIWVGVTSLNIDRLWRGKRVPGASPEYTRAVPTGPLAPMVFAVTTFRGAMQLGISFRSADMSRETAERVATAFLGQIRDPR
jgi:NRPS condensation-like uncharacterized protein